MNSLSDRHHPRDGQESPRADGTRRGFLASVVAGLGLTRVATSAPPSRHRLDDLYDALVVTWPACVELTSQMEEYLEDRKSGEGRSALSPWTPESLYDRLDVAEKARNGAYFTLMEAILDAAGFVDDWPDFASYDEWAKPVAVVRTQLRLYVVSPVPTTCPTREDQACNLTVAAIDLVAIPAVEVR